MSIIRFPLMFLGDELGSGPESTLASRDHWGCVSIQNSFKYVSPWYEITALHWRSLDDWLEGRCDPVALPDCFAGHDPYGETAQRVGKKSVAKKLVMRQTTMPEPETVSGKRSAPQPAA